MILDITQDLHDFYLNYLSEIIGAITISLFYFIWYFLNNLTFKRVFGCEIVKNYKLIYARFILIPVFDHLGRIIRFPYQKTHGGIRASIKNPVSFCEMRAIKYLVRTISKQTKYTPEIVSDVEYQGRYDLSFCSLGAFTNLKSIDVINSPRNSFYDFPLDNNNEYSSILNKRTRQQYFSDMVHDYAIILRLKSGVDRRKTHMCISGIGEWGTSGGAYYLGRHWRKIFIKTLFNSEFGMLIRVKHKSDDSAELVEILKQIRPFKLGRVLKEIWTEISCLWKKG